MSTTEERRPPLELTVRASLNDWPVDLHLSLPAEKVAAALERLAALGYSPRHDAPVAVAAPGQASKPKRPRATDVDPKTGAPLCPVHGTAMREGTYGWYCGHKAKDGEPAGPKGYCNATAD